MHSGYGVDRMVDPAQQNYSFCWAKLSYIPHLNEEGACRVTGATRPPPFAPPEPLPLGADAIA